MPRANRPWKPCGALNGGAWRGLCPGMLRSTPTRWMTSLPWSTAAPGSVWPRSQHRPVTVDISQIVMNNIYVFGIRGEGQSAVRRAAALMAQQQIRCIARAHAYVSFERTAGGPEACPREARRRHQGGDQEPGLVKRNSGWHPTRQSPPVAPGGQDTCPHIGSHARKVNDPVEYKRYTDLVPDILDKFGGKVLARGGRHEHLDNGGLFHQRHIVVEFPDIR